MVTHKAGIIILQSSSCFHFLFSDQDALVKYSHHLINEMINCLTQISGIARMSQQRKGTRSAFININFM